jgi:hypothetical protein
MKTRGEEEMWGWEKKFLFIKHKIQPTYLLPFGPFIISAHLFKSLVDLIFIHSHISSLIFIRMGRAIR